jgi:hemin uptake protein HemP
LISAIADIQPAADRERTGKVMNSHSHDNFHRRFTRAAVEAPRQVEPMHRPTRVVASSALFSGEHEIGISHAGSLYRLKITRQGKLILNK